MSQRTKVSVIIPVFNVEKYVCKCLESVCNQTLTDIQIVCVDDASTDNSKNILKEWAKSDSRICVLENQENRGLSFTRNVGLSNARGKYVYFVDSDDYMKSDIVLTEAYRILEDNELDGALFNAEVFYDGTDVSSTVHDGKRKGIYPEVYEGSELFHLLHKHGDFDAPVWKQIWKRDFLKRHNIYFHNGIIHEDFPFTFKSFFLAGRMMCTDLVAYVYRKRGDSITGNGRKCVDHFLSYLKIYRELSSFLEGKSYSPQVEEDICTFFEDIERHIVSWYLHTLAGMQMNYHELFEDSLARIIWKQAWRKKYCWLKRGLVKEEYEQLAACRHIIVYGTGRVGQDVLNLMIQYGFKDKVSLAVTKMMDEEKINNIVVKEIKELIYLRNSAIVIVAVSAKYRDEILNEVKRYGFRQYMCIYDR